MSRSVIAALTALTAAIEAENVALEALDLRCAASLLATKQEAAARLNAAGPAKPGVALHAATVSLMAAAETNRTLLERAIAVQGRVLAVLAAAARASAPPGRYARSGAYVPPRPVASALSARA